MGFIIGYIIDCHISPCKSWQRCACNSEKKKTLCQFCQNRKCLGSLVGWRYHFWIYFTSTVWQIEQELLYHLSFYRKKKTKTWNLFFYATSKCKKNTENKGPKLIQMIYCYLWTKANKQTLWNEAFEGS